MKSLKKILVLAGVMIVIVSCKNETTPEVKTVDVTTTDVKAELDPNANYAKAEFTIKGMTCEVGCAKTIEKKIAGMEGIKSVKVDFEAELAMVEFDEAKQNTTSIEETVVNVSDIYTVKNMRTVDAFEAKAAETGKEEAHVCSKEGMACCKGKTEVEKKACSEACKKECCAEKKDKA